jgi:hypothetical protein
LASTLSEAVSESAGRRWSETRLGRCALFLGIVWSLAAVWLILLQGIPTLFYAAMVRGLLPWDLTANSQLENEAARRCGAAGTAPPQALIPAEDTELQRARYAAFSMGVDLGMAGGVALFGIGGQPELVEGTLQGVRREALGLGVPVPELPLPRNVLSGHFVDDLVADRQCTEAQLERRYSPLHGHIYRFGAVIGYAAMCCINDLCGMHGPEVRHYAQVAGVPEHLWMPIARGSLADIPGTSAREKTFRLLATLDEYMATSR